MHVDWQSDDVPISLSPMLDHTPNGNSVLGFRRIVRANGSSQAYVLDLVADVDGPVHSAILRVDGPLPTSGCFTSADAVSGSHVIYQVYGADSVLDTKDLGAIGGDIDAIHPSVLLHFVATSPFTDGYAASSKWFARVTWPIVMYAYPWSDLSKQVFVTSSAVDPEGLTFSDLVMYEDALFFNTSTSYISGINSWNPVDGARPFVRFIGDATRGAGNLGTDGTVLVWSYGEGKKPDDPLEKFAKYDIMTAPFTTDSAALKPKRLRSDPIPRLSATPFQTACGFAAHGRPQDPFIVVRLSDGYSWSIPILGPDFHLQNPIGMSCDHLYALAQIGGRWNVARIKLSSLGTATPPD